MAGVQFTSPDGEREYAALVRAADGLVVGLDFDGTLAPIVDDPEQAHIHPRARDVLVRLGEAVHGVVVITGRPARQAVALGGLDEIGGELDARGRELLVLGQYGDERWSSHDRRVVSPKPPAGLASLTSELPAILRRADAEDAWIEQKGLAVGVHTRRLADPDAALDRLRGPVADAAARHGLVVEPGHFVLEVRAGDTDKGAAVRRVSQELDASAFCFVGDDLGDLAAFHAVAELRRGGLPGLLVVSGSAVGPPELSDLADVVVPGPDGVMDFLDQLVDDVRALRV